MNISVTKKNLNKISQLSFALLMLILITSTSSVKAYGAEGLSILLADKPEITVISGQISGSQIDQISTKMLKSLQTELLSKNFRVITNPGSKFDLRARIQIDVSLQKFQEFRESYITYHKTTLTLEDSSSSVIDIINLDKRVSDNAKDRDYPYIQKVSSQLVDELSESRSIAKWQPELPSTVANVQQSNRPTEHPAYVSPKPPINDIIYSDIQKIPDFNVSPRENALAVVIGIENYRSLPKSEFSKSDAGIMKEYLKALGFQERNINYLADDKATLSDIRKTVESWLPNRVKSDSTVFIYYSGHGAPEPSSGDAYIVPYDGDPNYLPVTGYPLKGMYGILGKLPAKEVVVLLDSCFSGAGGRSVLAKGARPLVMMAETTILSSNMAILSATQGSQISTSSPEKGHGVFTYYFLKALKNGKKNLAEIYENIKPLVEDEARTLNVTQTPSINPEPEKLIGRFNLRK